MNALHSPTAIKYGALETALNAPSSAVGSHHQASPVRIILSAKKRNQIVVARQKPSRPASPALMTMSGSARKKAVAHQAARSPT